MSRLSGSRMRGSPQSGPGKKMMENQIRGTNNQKFIRAAVHEPAFVTGNCIAVRNISESRVLSFMNSAWREDPAITGNSGGSP